MGGKLNINIIYYFAFTAFALFVVLPLFYMFASALSDDTFLPNLQLVDTSMLILLGKSTLFASLAGLFSTILGGTAGYILYFKNVNRGGFFKLMLLLPLFVSPYIFAVAWRDFSILTFGTSTFINSYTGLVLILTIVFSPLSMLVVGSAFSNIDTRLLESALLTVDYQKAVRKIILPLIKPAIISSFVLVFIFSISEFSVAAFLGVPTFTTEIFIQFSAFYNFSFAILQSLFLVLICVLLLLGESRYIADAPFLSLGGKGKRINKTQDAGSRSILFLSLMLLISVFLPLAILLWQSFRHGTAPFAKAFDLLKPAIANSVTLSAAAAIIILLTGFFAAARVFGRNGKHRRSAFDWLLLIVFATPSIILGIGLIKFYNRPELNFVYSGVIILLIAYAGKFSFISAKLIGNAIGQIPVSLYEAAAVAGIPLYKQISKILLPLIMPSVFAAFVIAFILSFGELGTTIMLYPPGTEILPIKVFTLSANAPQSITSSMSLIVFLLMLLLVGSFYLIYKFFLKKSKI
jgi:ABC-type Fe3+ transport system permease subunit